MQIMSVSTFSIIAKFGMGFSIVKNSKPLVISGTVYHGVSRAFTSLVILIIELIPMALRDLAFLRVFQTLHLSHSKALCNIPVMLSNYS